MTTVATFQTPPRILIPKLVRSRDTWKAKAGKRKTQCKALEIRVRDLQNSREHHRQQADQLRERVQQLQEQVQQLQGQLETLRATAEQSSATPLAATSPKNSTALAAGTTVPLSSTSR